MHPSRQFPFALLFVLSVLWQGHLGRADEKGTAVSPAKCAAATPVENPWTKRLPKGWWKQRHDDILAAPGRAEAELVFIGDSITDGWDQEGSGLATWEKEYVPMKALNLGINCDSTQHVLWRLDNGEIDGLQNLKVAIVMIGTNNKGITRDEPADIAIGIEALCDRLKAKVPHAKILLLGVFPKFFGKDKHAVINGTIAKLHDGERIFYLNINDKLIETEGAIKDRVGHLTDIGYQVWADAIRTTLKELMATGSDDAKKKVEP
jgi:lysophospholipase L1-like esterase